MILSDAVKRDLAERLIFDAVESIEFLTVSEFVIETMGYSADHDDLLEVDELIRYCSLDIVFDTDD